MSIISTNFVLQLKRDDFTKQRVIYYTMVTSLSFSVVRPKIYTVFMSNVRAWHLVRNIVDIVDLVISGLFI